MMISRIGRAVIMLILLAAAIFLAASAMPSFRTDIVRADDGQWYGKIWYELKKEIEGLEPTDNISVIVVLKKKADYLAKINQVRAPTWKAIAEINEEITRRRQAVNVEFKNKYGADVSILYLAGDSTAFKRYEEIEMKYGVDPDSMNRQDEEIQKMLLDSEKRVIAFLEEEYGGIHAQVKQAIEALPDTKVVLPAVEYFTSLCVHTKVGNIDALVQMSAVEHIYNNPRGTLINGSGHYEPTLLSPANGSSACLADQLYFSWSPYKETTEYKFVLAKDSATTQIVKEARTNGTNYQYDGTLDYGTNYFWRVMAIEPVPSDWSATFSFQTEAAPPPETPPQSTTWSPTLILGLLIASGAAIGGCIIWLFIIKKRKAK